MLARSLWGGVRRSGGFCGGELLPMVVSPFFLENFGVMFMFLQ